MIWQPVRLPKRSIRIKPPKSPRVKVCAFNCIEAGSYQSQIPRQWAGGRYVRGAQRFELAYEEGNLNFDGRI